MATQVLCPRCGKKNNKEDTEQIGKRYYCTECARITKEEKEAKKEDWDLLFEYICKLYNIKKPTGMMFKQLKEFRSEPYNYTDSGMYETLKYYYETLENNVIEGTGLGIIPYYYDKAKEHWNTIFEVENSAEEYKEPKNQSITINPNSQRDLMKKLQMNKQLNLQDIDWSEDDE